MPVERDDCIRTPLARHGCALGRVERMDVRIHKSALAILVFAALFATTGYSCPLALEHDYTVRGPGGSYGYIHTSSNNQPLAPRPDAALSSARCPPWARLARPDPTRNADWWHRDRSCRIARRELGLPQFTQGFTMLSVTQSPNKSRQAMPGVRHDCIHTPSARHACA